MLGLLLRLSETAAVVEAEVLEALQKGFGSSLRNTVERLSSRLQRDSVPATLVSLIGLVVAVAALFRHLRVTFRAIWKYRPPLAAAGIRGAVRAMLFEQVVAFLMVLGGGVLLVGAVVLIGAVHWLNAVFADLPLFDRTSALLLAVPGPLIIVPVTFALLFRYLPPTRLPWRDVWLASVLSAVAWMAGTELLALYAATFGANLGAYGVLGGILLGVLWMNVMSQVLFYGAELCKVVNKQRAARQETLDL